MSIYGLVLRLHSFRDSSVYSVIFLDSLLI